jgi:hypothetical protein
MFGLILVLEYTSPCPTLINVVDKEIDLHWVRAFTVPMHLNLIALYAP